MGQRPVANPRAVPESPPAGVVTLNRMGFGPKPGDVEAFLALGSSDPERLASYVAQQLNPGSIDDSAADARLAQASFATLGKSVQQLWQQHYRSSDWEVRIQPLEEVIRATFIRAIHSRRQLLVVMTDFWHNHFNVYAHDTPAASLWAHTDRDVIRANAFGNFRHMLGAVAKSPPMLFYLDNWLNEKEDANENFARELLELHTLGATAYLGNIPQDQVPVDGNGWPLGWVEDDVVAAARCLTGWTVDVEWIGPPSDTGTFLYLHDWHDTDPKHVLGTDIPGDRGLEDGQDLLDLVAQHPATGRFVAEKLCRRLIADEPPQNVVDAAAAVFTQQHHASDQIAQVLEVILLAPEFLGTWGEKVKRPFEVVVSAFRGAQGDLPFTLDESETNWFLWEYEDCGQPLFGWPPPNGYPDTRASWNSTSPRVTTWRVMNVLIRTEDGDNTGDYYFDVLGQTPADVRSAFDLVTFWTHRVLRRPMPQGELDALVDFMAQGVNPAYDLPLDTDEGVQGRLRTLLAILFMCPSFLWR